MTFGKIVLVTFICMTGAIGYAAPMTHFMTIRNMEQSDALVTRLCALRPCLELKASTVEFDNTNTFVRLHSNVINSEIAVLLPPQMTTDQLMEALIKIRTAASLGAASVAVAFNGELSEIKVVDRSKNIIELDLATLISAAGARSMIKLRNGESQVIKQKGPRPNFSVKPKTILMSLSHDQLAAQLSDELEIPVLNARDYDASYVKGANVFLVAPSPAPVNENLFRALSVISKLRRQGARVSLITPYLPYARSDKVDQPGISVTGRLVADLIESAGTNSLYFMRAHAPQSQGFFAIPSFHLYGRDTVNPYLKSQAIDMVISPDAGFQKEATLYAKELNLPVAVINKQRDPLTSQIKIYGISGSPVNGLKVAIIDDETASGKTMGEAAEFLKGLGATKVYAIVTHLAGNAEKALQSTFIDEVVVTNSLPVSAEVMTNPKLRVLSVAPEIAVALRPLFTTAPISLGCPGLFN